ncbi:hypothetical protein BDV96DRAFT_152124 [Lophiotrema nucula]|uniref:Uncharacterized protein n=1 Tax=Lophiotrema nucula TaxID=690887 RepID=A0A6A5Z0Z8_9PLEO|nr:hypothetical protein BDV96DRAFT_152124 [Lophiotrema nucula]
MGLSSVCDLKYFWRGDLPWTTSSDWRRHPRSFSSRTIAMSNWGNFEHSLEDRTSLASKNVDSHDHDTAPRAPGAFKIQGAAPELPRTSDFNNIHMFKRVYFKSPQIQDQEMRSWRNKNMLRIITSPLQQSECRAGKFVILWPEGCPGLIWAGSVTDSPEQHFKTLNKRCGKYEWLLPLGLRHVQIPYVARMDKILRTQWEHHHLSETCPRCGNVHEHLFCITKDSVMDVYLRWFVWMLRSPYERKPDGMWVLKQDALSWLEQM